MKNNLNRIYSFLLATLMIVGMLSASAFSEENTVSDEDTLDLKNMKQAYSIISNELDISAVTLTPQDEAGEEKEATDANLEIEIVLLNTEPIDYGVELHLEASVSGPDAEKELVYQWESSPDGETWEPIEGETEKTFSFVLDEDNVYTHFHVVVNLKAETEEDTAAELAEEGLPVEPADGSTEAGAEVPNEE